MLAGDVRRSRQHRSPGDRLFEVQSLEAGVEALAFVLTFGCP
jgi:hypothetical protein